MARRELRVEDYTVGWICALPVELAASVELLDEEHGSLPGPTDHNSYIFGRISNHDVVMACLPAGQMGISSATLVATQMRLRFTEIKFCLLVGIGGGVPSVDRDVRLGDVVISQPHLNFSGVVQYDFAKTGPAGQNRRIGSLNAPPHLLLTALAVLRANILRERSEIKGYLRRLSHLPQFTYQGGENDLLFKATYNHVKGPTCEFCNKDELLSRKIRQSSEPVLHFGTIASGNQVIKDGATRDRISAELDGILCYEMEAAGLMNIFPSLVIRGICDYADSHKNKRWQPYAAATAAACAKELLQLVPGQRETEKDGFLVLNKDNGTRGDVEGVDSALATLERKALDSRLNRQPAGHPSGLKIYLAEDIADECARSARNIALSWLFVPSVQEINPEDFSWFVESPEYTTWLKSDSSEILWLTGQPDSGKTMVAQHVVAELLDRQRLDERLDVGFIFLEELLPKAVSHGSYNTAVRCLLYLAGQFLGADLNRISLVRPSEFSTEAPIYSYFVDPSTTPEAVQKLLWRIFHVMSGQRIHVIIDGVDKVDPEVRKQILHRLMEIWNAIKSKNGMVIKFLISSRSFSDISIVLKDAPAIDKDTERRHCLNSLFFKDLHAGRSQVSKAQEGTSQWIWFHEAYLKWSRSKSSILWIQGKPGSGKSTLAKLIQQTLYSECMHHGDERQTKDLKVKDTIVADFFYTARGISNATSHKLMLQSLLYQVLEQGPSLFKHYQPYFRTLRRDGGNRFEWPSADLKAIFLSLAGESSREGDSSTVQQIVFLVDGMDESEDDKDGHMRAEILSLISQLCMKRAERIIKMIIVSRPATGIETNLGRFHHIELQKENRADIRMIVDAGLHMIWKSVNDTNDDSESDPESGGERIDSFEAETDEQEPSPSYQYPEELRFVRDFFLEHAAGVILWVVLKLRELLQHVERRSYSEQELRKLLESLPTDLEKSYEDIIRKLQDSQSRDHISQGRIMLNWGSFGERPLSVEEFRDALAVSDESPALITPAEYLRENRIYIPDNNWSLIRRRIVDLCGSLLEIRGHAASTQGSLTPKSRRVSPKDTVQLLHQTVKDFLMQNKNARPFNLDQVSGDRMISSSCLKYLKLCIWTEGASCIKTSLWGRKDYQDFVTYLHDRPLLGYVLLYLPSHLSRADAIEIKSGLVGLLQNIHKEPEMASWKLLEGWCREHKLLDLSVSDKTQEDFLSACLITASEAGMASVAQLILDAGANIENNEVLGPNALQVAVQAGHEAVVRLLLEKKSDFTARGDYGETALHYAASNGHLAITRHLLEAGARAEAKNNFGDTPLHKAAMIGHTEIIEALLKRGVDIEAANNFGYTALHIGLRHGKEAAVQLLIAKGARLATVNNIDGTALHEASSCGSEALVQLLLDNGAYIDSRGIDGGTPLARAAEKGHKGVVELLLNNGAHPSISDNYSVATPLHEAARNGHEGVIKLLLHHGADNDIKDSYSGSTALHLAATNGHSSIVKILLDSGADITSRDAYGLGTALHWAASAGQWLSVQELLERGAEVNAPDIFGRTPFTRAVEEGHEAIAKLLLLHKGLRGEGVFGLVSEIEEPAGRTFWKKRSR